jgi:hypothetical protein
LFDAFPPAPDVYYHQGVPLVYERSSDGTERLMTAIPNGGLFDVNLTAPWKRQRRCLALDEALKLARERLARLTFSNLIAVSFCYPLADGNLLVIESRLPSSLPRAAAVKLGITLSRAVPVAHAFACRHLFSGVITVTRPITEFIDDPLPDLTAQIIAGR